jgi:hypothetical protein
MDYTSDPYPNPPSKIYQSTFVCDGDETSLDQCAHSGFQAATSTFCTHDNDAKVICFDDGQLEFSS